MSETKVVLEDLIKDKDALKTVVNEMDARLKDYEALGTVQDVTSAIEKAKAIVESLGGMEIEAIKAKLDEHKAYAEVGTVAEVNESMDKAIDTIKEYQGLGSIGELKEKLQLLASYESLGSFEEVDKAIDKAIETVKQYQALGSVEDLETAIVRGADVIESYIELGTPEDIDEALDLLNDKIVESKCEQLAAKHNLKAETIMKIYEKSGDFDSLEILLAETMNIKPEIGAKTTINESKSTTQAKDSSKPGNVLTTNIVRSVAGKLLGN